MFKRFFSRQQKTALSEEPAYTDLFNYLNRQITVPKNAAHLVQLGKNAAGKKEGIFHTYLLFEKYLCTFEPEQKFTRESLRSNIRQRFPVLVSDPAFEILFLSDTARKNTLAIHFLLSFLEKANERF